MYGNWLDNLVNSSDEEVIIWSIRNTKGPQTYLVQSEDRVTDNFELKEKKRLEEMIKDWIDVSILL